uniref:1-acylglycerol-3-phosphate O-acyltransferase n=1 Tax=Physcomitrium patens TaxID=3218 RepID=A0A7I4DYR6_PHYPA
MSWASAWFRAGMRALRCVMALGCLPLTARNSQVLFHEKLDSFHCVAYFSLRAMEGGGSLIALPLGLMFIFSGLFINGLQVISVLFILPFSRRAYRVVNMIMMEALWSELVWLLDWWAGVKVKVYTPRETSEHLGKERALVISNHRSDIDWLVGWIIAQRLGCLGGTRAVMKKSTKFLPVIGWSMWFSEYVFLSRNWTKDEKVLKNEGTRFTKAKLEAARKYATEAGLRVPRHVLVPRTKGFVSAVENLREFVPAVYDMTVAVSKELPSPTMVRIFRGQPSVVHVHVRWVPMSDLPQEANEISKWCHDAFEIKDDRLEQHEKENTFGEDLYIPIERPLKPLIFVISWAITLLAAAWWMLRPIFSTWKGIAWVVGVLVVVMLCVQVLIMSSQSERSSDPTARRVKQKQAAYFDNGHKKD